MTQPHSYPPIVKTMENVNIVILLIAAVTLIKVFYSHTKTSKQSS